VKVLLLGPRHPAVERALEAAGDTFVRTEERVGPDDDLLRDADFLVSYGFRYIIPASVLARFGERAINLHVSLLPWNRGADPNLWSYLEDTPKGVSIHVLDPGVDTGPIVAQRLVAEGDRDTLRTSYDRLTSEVEALFAEVWPGVRAGAARPASQMFEGSSHRSAEKEPFMHLLSEGWNTPVESLRGAARRADDA
jgi:methionyl-tRNA formyltransferase